MQLPSAAAAAHNRFSSMSIDESAPPPSTASTLLSRQSSSSLFGGPAPLGLQVGRPSVYGDPSGLKTRNLLTWIYTGTHVIIDIQGRP